MTAATGGAIVPVPVRDVIALRERVLRRGTPVRDATYPEDHDDGTVHLAVVHDGAIVATSTWLERECPEAPGRPAVQLRGMAVEPELQGTGVGTSLIEAGLSRARSLGATLVWARARDSALGFYTARGFAVAGDGFIDETTGLGHHVVMRGIESLDYGG